MNIFILDKNPIIAAQMQCDKHVVKMIVESAQMLSTAHRMLDGYVEKRPSKSGKRIIGYWVHPNKNYEATLYKAVHHSHPCTIWTRTNKSNYLWLFRLWKNLSMEYTLRYGRFHASWTKLNMYLGFPPKNISEGDLTEQPQCMPDHCKDEEDVVEAYRNYYIKEKSSFAKWKFASTPDWVEDGAKHANV